MVGTIRDQDSLKQSIVFYTKVKPACKTLFASIFPPSTRKMGPGSRYETEEELSQAFEHQKEEMENGWHQR